MDLQESLQSRCFPDICVEPPDWDLNHVDKLMALM